MRIHITGGSGSGTTTLARALSQHLDWPMLDSDDFYWMPTDPPYQVKRPPDVRDRLLREALRAAPAVVHSGAALSWDLGPGDPFDLIVVLDVPRRLRLQRLRSRECAEFGREAISTGGTHRDEYVEFLRWAARYETGGLEIRSRTRVEAWLVRFACPVIRIVGDTSIEQRVERVQRAIRPPPG